MVMSQVIDKVQRINARALDRGRAWRRAARKRLGLKASGTPTGYVLYEGPSEIDGAPIVVIVTGVKRGSKNAKTGDMLQVWILRQDMSPMEAVLSGMDRSICGDCGHRREETDEGTVKRTCYVDVSKAPHAVWSAYQRGSYPVLDVSAYADLFTGAIVRFGAYGDPAAAPVVIFRLIAAHAAGRTGYTHQWLDMPADLAAQWRGLVMASADSAALAERAQSEGWRTFRVSTSTTSTKGEIECLSESKGVSCAACKLCDGAASKPNIVIQAHGIGARSFRD